MARKQRRAPKFERRSIWVKSAVAPGPGKESRGGTRERECSWTRGKLIYTRGITRRRERKFEWHFQEKNMRTGVEALTWRKEQDVRKKKAVGCHEREGARYKTAKPGCKIGGKSEHR